ncbi:MAG: family N-acetyltransferase [Frankiales bacterium]|nr:family N-acetyltransferase [Frankiales bacterium]
MSVSTSTATETVVQRACALAGVTVLEMRTPAETERGAALLREVWRSSESPVPSNLLRTVQHTGGYVFGAYDDGGALLGVAMGLLSTDGLHSHITGVVPAGQRRGLGFALKQHQRWWALDRGLATITWTCDPLVRRNLAFNLHALGADVHAYLPDHYGAMTDGVNAGDESDRFELHWDLLSDRAVQAAQGRLAWVAGERTVPLPEDIEALRLKDPALARAWRFRVREGVVPALADGAVVLGLDPEGALVLS